MADDKKPDQDDKNHPQGGTAQNSLEGTSRQPHDNKQQNSQMLNPDAENAKGPAAAPGVVPSDQANRPKSELVLDREVAISGNEPEPQKSVRHQTNKSGETGQWYIIQQGKHRYRDPESNEWVTASANTGNNKVWLTQKQYDKLGDRFKLQRVTQE